MLIICEPIFGLSIFSWVFAIYIGNPNILHKNPKSMRRKNTYAEKHTVWRTGETLALN